MTTHAPMQPDNRLNWPVLLLVWAAVCVFLITRALLEADHVPLLRDTDDAMRLVVVRDFLAGQGWFDHVQLRLNAPFGAEIHWSRLVDLPIAGLILMFRPFAGNLAEMLAGYVWPLLQLLPMLALSASITLRLVGREGLLPALALPVLSPAIIAEFSPGRLDHHGIQIVLTLALVWCVLAALRRPRWAIGAGVVAATALAIGTEAVPALVSAVLAFGLLWVAAPRHAATMRGFGIALALATLGHLALYLPPDRWFEPACDALSIVYVAAAVAIGLALTVLSMLPLAQLPTLARLAAGGVFGAIAVAVVVVLYPACLAGPYAGFDPWLVTNWLDRIIEAKPVWVSLTNAPELTIGFCVPPLLALLALGWRLTRADPPDRAGWLLLAAFLVVAVAVMLVQVRGARLATPLGVPAAAWVIARARAAYLARGGLGGAARLVGTWLAFAGIALLVGASIVSLTLEQMTARPGAPVAATATGNSDPCLMPAAYDDLAALPPERIMAPVDLGSHLLLHTPHSVVAAPYHRNQVGVRDAFDFFDLPVAEARAILDRRGVTLVVTCTSRPGMGGLPLAAEDSFVRLYARGALPAWLDDVSLPGSPLAVFSVRPAEGP